MAPYPNPGSGGPSHGGEEDQESLTSRSQSGDPEDDLDHEDIDEGINEIIFDDETNPGPVNDHSGPRNERQPGIPPSRPPPIQTAPIIENEILEVSVETLLGTTFEMRLPSKTTVGRIKARLQCSEGIPKQHLHLLYRGMLNKNQLLL